MPTTTVSIINSALIELGLDKINATTDNTERARVCVEVYETELRSLLEEHPWNFAIARQSLSQTSNTPLNDYDYEYQLPSDYRATKDINTEVIPYVIEGDKLLTNYDGAVYLTYVKDFSDESKLPYTFVVAFAARLAAKVSPKLTTKREGVKERMEALYMKRLAIAKNADGSSSGSPSPKRPMNFINARVTNYGKSN